MRPLVQAGDLVGGKYRLEREIGTGGMGVVYAATHVHLEQQVALKFLLPDAAQNAELVERFWREARAAVKIQSEHVARVMDIGELENGGTPYIVMEYLEGDDLDNIVKASGPLAVQDAVRYVLHTCEALAEVHVQGMVHRDIKPANLFLAERADGSRIVKLLDFGISKAAQAFLEEGGRSLTQTAAVIGSPRYMSPEQLRSSRSVDQRSDVWALGVTLFELLGGKSPFARGTMPEVCASILKDDPLPLAGLRPDVPAALEQVIKRCLAKEPGARWKNVAELAIALRPFGPLGIIDISIERIVGVLQHQAEGRRPSSPPPTAKRDSAPPPAVKQDVREVRESTPPKAFAKDFVVLPPIAKGDSTPPVNKERPRAAVTERLDTEIEKTLLDQLGGGTKIPRLSIDEFQVPLLKLDHRAGFVLSCVDGSSTVDEILDVSGMARVDALKILNELRERGVIKVKL